jgi:hypothetical protein
LKNELEIFFFFFFVFLRLSIYFLSMIEYHLLPHKAPPWLDSWLIKAVPKNIDLTLVDLERTGKAKALTPFCDQKMIVNFSFNDA